MEPLLGGCDLRLGLLNLVTLSVLAWGFFRFGVECERARRGKSQEPRNAAGGSSPGAEPESSSSRDREWETDLARMLAAQWEVRDAPKDKDGRERVATR